ncbi:MAG TPA: winged helix-turn-helix domain-containing protein [Nevskiaceae bacterium]|nr:winged helix-turn-helix domain-containing protein [Nevskiaceae bacterium]
MTADGSEPREGGWRVYRFANLCLEERSLVLSRDGQALEIEPKPLLLLRHLLQHAGEVVTREELLQAVWPGRVLSETTLAKAVGRLRATLGEHDPPLIVTVHGFGYRLVAPVRVEAAAAEPRSALALQPGDSPPLRPHWRLVQRLGGGGQGETWLARHQHHGEQRVFKFALDAGALSGLKREITLFRLLHESLGEAAPVVRVLDWNLEQPPCFIESEWLAEGSLADWASRGPGLAALSLPARVELVARLAEALARVHAMGVLHKDLKPANVLVAGQREGIPDLRLADFGSAGVLDAARLRALGITRLGFTQTLALPAGGGSGTPLYLAPEVMAGQPLTVASDLYALGVILYQTVIGDLRRPLAPGWEAEVADPLLREDIAASAEGNPARRLSDAQELARRLRSLASRRAEREAEQRERQRAEQTRRDLERLRARRTGLRIAALALALGLGLSLWAYRDARAARLQAQQVADFLSQDLLASLSAGERPAREFTVLELLDQAAAQVEARFTGQPRGEQVVRAALGRGYLRLQAYESAARELSQALALARAEGEGSAAALGLAVELLPLIHVAGGFVEREAEFVGLLEAGRARLGDTHPDLLRLQTQLVQMRYRHGRWQEAASSLAVLLDRLPERSAEPHLRGLRSALLHLQALIQQDLGQLPEAEGQLRRLLQEDPGEGLPQATLRASLAEVLRQRGRLDEAEAELAQALRIYQRWGREQDGEVQTVRHRQALCQADRGELAAAIQALQGVVETVAGWNMGMDQSGIARRDLGELLLRGGRLDEAVTELRRATRSQAALLGETHPLTRRARLSLVEAQLAAGDADGAQQSWRQPAPLAFDDLPPTHPWQALHGRIEAGLRAAGAAAPGR